MPLVQCAKDKVRVGCLSTGRGRLPCRGRATPLPNSVREHRDRISGDQHLLKREGERGGGEGGERDGKDT